MNSWSANHSGNRQTFPFTTNTSVRFIKYCYKKAYTKSSSARINLWRIYKLILEWMNSCSALYVVCKLLALLKRHSYSLCVKYYRMVQKRLLYNLYLKPSPRSSSYPFVVAPSSSSFAFFALRRLKRNHTAAKKHTATVSNPHDVAIPMV